MKKQYKYMTSYHWLKKGTTGFGRCLHNTNRKMDPELIVEIENSLEIELEFDKVLLISFQLL
jgi:hypothetical protein